MANKLFNYFFIKKEKRSRCLTLYGKQREICTIKNSIENQKEDSKGQREIKEYFESCLSLAPVEYFPNRACLRN